MAKLKFGGEMNSYGIISSSDYFGVNFSIESDLKKQAIYRDTTQDGSVVFDGSGIQYDDDAMVAGTISKITFRTPDDESYLTVTGEFKAADLYARFDLQGVDGLYNAILKGADTVAGSFKNDFLKGLDGKDKLNGGAGNDWLNGGAGNDRLTGGDGSDLFIFAAGGGHDVITDFDADGGEGNQDFLYFEGIETSETHKDGRNTVIEFEDGGSVTLLYVKPGQITEADFDTPG